MKTRAQIAKSKKDRAKLIKKKSAHGEFLLEAKRLKEKRKKKKVKK